MTKIVWMLVGPLGSRNVILTMDEDDKKLVQHIDAYFERAGMKKTHVISVPVSDGGRT